MFAASRFSLSSWKYLIEFPFDLDFTNFYGFLEICEIRYVLSFIIIIAGQIMNEFDIL